MLLLILLIGKLLDWIRLDYYRFAITYTLGTILRPMEYWQSCLWTRNSFYIFALCIFYGWFFWESHVLQALYGGPLALSSMARCSIALGFKQSGYDELHHGTPTACYDV